VFVISTYTIYIWQKHGERMISLFVPADHHSNGLTPLFLFDAKIKE
jgi:hypothetical protein